MFHAAEHVFTTCQRRLSQKRPKRKPSPIHIRKASMSGSLSSASSSSSHTSSSSSGTAIHRHHLHDETVDFDPLLMHPTYQPPARLHDRPILAAPAGEAVVDSEPRISQEEENEWRFLIDERSRIEAARGLEMPPVDTPTPGGRNADHTTIGGGGSVSAPATDYFMLQMQAQARPPLPRSHWSESTIMTIDTAATATTPTPLDIEADLERPAAAGAPPRQPASGTGAGTGAVFPNFSYKRNTVPRRPPMKGADSVENFIKRGGWKRRGIVFQQDPEWRHSSAVADDDTY